MTGVLRWYGRDVIGDVEAAAEAALEEVAEFIAAESDATAPIETGHMIRTRRVQNTGRLERHITYDTPYVVRQHEDTRLRHDPGRRAKFLELALVEQKDRALKWLADRLAKPFQRGGGL